MLSPPWERAIGLAVVLVALMLELQCLRSSELEVVRSQPNFTRSASFTYLHVTIDRCFELLVHPFLRPSLYLHMDAFLKLCMFVHAVNKVHRQTNFMKFMGFEAFVFELLSSTGKCIGRRHATLPLLNLSESFLFHLPFDI